MWWGPFRCKCKRIIAEQTNNSKVVSAKGHCTTFESLMKIFVAQWPFCTYIDLFSGSTLLGVKHSKTLSWVDMFICWSDIQVFTGWCWAERVACMPLYSGGSVAFTLGVGHTPPLKFLLQRFLFATRKAQLSRKLADYLPSGQVPSSPIQFPFLQIKCQDSSLELQCTVAVCSVLSTHPLSGTAKSRQISSTAEEVNEKSWKWFLRACK